MRTLNQLDREALAALRAAVDAYQQFEQEPAARYFKKIIERLIGGTDDLNIWAIRELIDDEYARRDKRTKTAIVSNDIHERINRLSNQERRVLCLIAEGHRSEAIAELLSISYRPVANHKANLSGKLGLGTAKELTRFAVTNLNLL